MRSAARITSSGRKSSTGVFFARICRLIDDWMRRRWLSRHLDGSRVAVLPAERVEVDDRPVELVVDVDAVIVTKASRSSSMRTSSSAITSRSVSPSRAERG